MTPLCLVSARKLIFHNFFKYSIRNLCIPSPMKFTACSRPVHFTLKRFDRNYETSHYIFNGELHQLLHRNGYHVSSIHHKENEVKRILSIPENKFNQFNIINSSDIEKTLRELENLTAFIAETDVKKLSKLTYHAVAGEYRLNNHLVEKFWDFATSLKGFHFTNEHLSLFLSLCLLSPHPRIFKEIRKFINDHDVKMNQEIGELLVANFCHQGDLKETERVLSCMESLNLSMNEKIFSSLILLNGKIKNIDGVQKEIMAMQRARLSLSSISQSAKVIAYNLCQEFEEAKAVMKDMKKSADKFSSNEFCNIILSFVLDGSCKKNIEHLNYILSSRIEIAGDIDLKKVILKLIHSGFPSEAIYILSMQPRYLKNPHLNSNASIFIRELVRSKNDTTRVVELCDDISSCGLNANALLVALEVALSEHRVELAWRLLRALKATGFPVREHFFWPLLSLQHPNDDHVAKTFRILDGMKELAVTPGSETLRDYVLPNLPIDSPDLALQMLSNRGVSKTRALTPLLATLISKQRFTEALDAAKGCNAPFDLGDLVHPLATSFAVSPSSTVRALKTLTDLARQREEGPSKDVAAEFVLGVLKAFKGAVPEDQMGRLVQEMTNNGIPFPKTLIDEIADGQRNEGEAEGKQPLSTSKGQGGSFPHPKEMTLQELEGHLEELKSKQMNTGGVLRKLLLKYSQVKDKDKMAEVLQELKTSGQAKSPGVLSAALHSSILESDADAAIEDFYGLVLEFPSFKIDSYKVVDLCCLLARLDRIQDSLEVMRSYTQSTPKEFHQKEGIIRNCNRLLVEFANSDGYSSVREMCSLLLTGGLAHPSPILLGPLIKAKLNNNDLSGAVEEAEELYSTYKVLPMRLEILIRLMRALLPSQDKSATEVQTREPRLEELVDRMVSLTTRSRGSRQAQQDILYATIETGNAAEAQKVFLHVKGSLDKRRMRELCNFLVRYEKTECLRLLLVISKGSFTVDRHFVCESLLNIFYVRRDGEAALSLWTFMQEEQLRASLNFTNKLSKLLEATATAQQPPVT